MCKRDMRLRANIAPQSGVEGGHDWPDSEQSRKLHMVFIQSLPLFAF